MGLHSGQAKKLRCDDYAELSTIATHAPPGGKARQDLDRDETFALALVRFIEVIGKAAAKVSVDVQERHTNIPWKEIVGTRNRLIH